jgi:hypothetical protein
MAVNKDKIDDAALALLYITLHDDHRAWIGASSAASMKKECSTIPSVR